MKTTGNLFSGRRSPIRSIFFSILSVLFFCQIQIRLGAQPASSPKQAVFLEGGGAAPYYSLNYSRRIFQAGTAGGYLRIGAGIWGDNLSLPVGLTTLFGNGKHHPELTLSISPFFEGLQFWDRDASDLLLDLVLGVGYRYEPPEASFFLSLGAFPYLRLDPTSETLSEKAVKLRIRPGLSGGWRF